MHMDPIMPTLVAGISGILLVGITMRILKQPRVLILRKIVKPRTEVERHICL